MGVSDTENHSSHPCSAGTGSALLGYPNHPPRHACNAWLMLSSCCQYVCMPVLHKDMAGAPNDRRFQYANTYGLPGMQEIGNRFGLGMRMYEESGAQAQG